VIGLSLPLPPSVNNLFVNVPGRGRAPSSHYTKWKSDAAICIMAARQKPIAGPFQATLTFDAPDKRPRDLDNMAKAPLDALKRAGLIEDDRLARKLTLEWGDAKPKGAEVHVIIEGVIG
jgi:crossover junction endodeoxyribonuclease RusA